VGTRTVAVGEVDTEAEKARKAEGARRAPEGRGGAEAAKAGRGGGEEGRAEGRGEGRRGDRGGQAGEGRTPKPPRPRPRRPRRRGRRGRRGGLRTETRRRRADAPFTLLLSRSTPARRPTRSQHEPKARVFHRSPLRGRGADFQAPRHEGGVVRMAADRPSRIDVRARGVLRIADDRGDLPDEFFRSSPGRRSAPTRRGISCTLDGVEDRARPTSFTAATSCGPSRRPSRWRRTRSSTTSSAGSPW
jgi:hypothetical protein